MLRKLVFPHYIIIAVLSMAFIWLLDLVRLNLHFLDPFNKGVKDYEVTDIVYSRLRDETIELDSNIVLVNCGKPHRDTLRFLLDRIIGAGPKVVGIDLLLSERKEAVSDSLLVEQLKRMPQIVLGTRLEGYNETSGVFEGETDCDPYFRDNVYTGFTNFPVNETQTIRLFSPVEKTLQGESLAFAARMAKLFAPEKAEALFKRGNEAEEIYYSGGADNFLQFEPENILDTSINLKPLIEGKAVIIGFMGAYEWDNPMLDRFFTPMNRQYTGRNVPDTYGGVIHANVLKMILDGVYIRKPSYLVNLFLTFLFVYLNIILFYKFFRRKSFPYHFLVRFVQVVEIITLFFLVAAAFHYLRLRIEVVFAIATMLITFNAIKLYENFLRPKVPFLNKIPDRLQGKKVQQNPPPPSKP